MRTRTAAAGAVLAAVMTAATAACGGGETASPASRSATVSTTPAPGPSSTAHTPTDAPSDTSSDAAPPSRTPAKTPSDTPSRTPDAARTLVETTVTGGYAGVHDRLVVKDDGSYTTTSRGGSSRSGQMTPAELTALREALEKADFARLPSEATGSPIADGFTYRITHAGRTVTTDDLNRLPALRAVFAALPAD
ncbi:hypothetical protein AB0M39_34705 [Streptomyces sp. NPDC051907]|uniref:hypothetical protein n=1 Tax=Streptomyces sp. NPDC051907 TaxID=3155284 RepID=UPI00343EC0E5